MEHSLSERALLVSLWNIDICTAFIYLLFWAATNCDDIKLNWIAWILFAFSVTKMILYFEWVVCCYSKPCYSNKQWWGAPNIKFPFHHQTATLCFYDARKLNLFMSQILSLKSLSWLECTCLKYWPLTLLCCQRLISALVKCCKILL